MIKGNAIWKEMETNDVIFVFNRRLIEAVRSVFVSIGLCRSHVAVAEVSLHQNNPSKPEQLPTHCERKAKAAGELGRRRGRFQ